MKLTTMHYALFGGLVAIGILGGFGYWYFMMPQTIQEESTPSGQPIIKILPVEEAVIRDVMPDLTKEIIFSPSYNAEGRNILTERITGLRSHLGENPLDSNGWFDLALNYHSAGDYAQAAEVWEFLIKIVPDDTISYDNLGKLYHFHLKDFPKSESYLKKSIEINPKLSTPYLELHSLYRYSYKQNTTAAADILKELSKQFPSDPQPVFWLGVYYAERGENALARKTLEEALDIARSEGMVELIGTIGDELAKLPQ